MSSSAQKKDRMPKGDHIWDEERGEWVPRYAGLPITELKGELSKATQARVDDKRLEGILNSAIYRGQLVLSDDQRVIVDDALREAFNCGIDKAADALKEAVTYGRKDEMAIDATIKRTVCRSLQVWQFNLEGSSGPNVSGDLDRIKKAHTVMGCR